MISSDLAGPPLNTCQQSGQFGQLKGWAFLDVHWGCGGRGSVVAGPNGQDRRESAWPVTRACFGARRPLRTMITDGCRSPSRDGDELPKRENWFETTIVGAGVLHDS